MCNIRFTDCDEDFNDYSKITGRFQGLLRLQDFKDFRKIIGIACIDRGLWDYSKDYSEDCSRLQGSVRPLGGHSLRNPSSDPVTQNASWSHRALMAIPPVVLLGNRCHTLLLHQGAVAPATSIQEANVALNK